MPSTKIDGRRDHQVTLRHVVGEGAPRRLGPGAG
jgi:hypothetical protein